VTDFYYFYYFIVGAYDIVKILMTTEFRVIF